MAVAADPHATANTDTEKKASEAGGQSAWHPLTTPTTWIAFIVWLVLTDVALYRGGLGWNGWSATGLGVPLAILIGPRKKELHPAGFAIAVGTLILLAAKILWSGSVAEVFSVFAMSIVAIAAGHGAIPTVGRCLSIPMSMLVGPCEAFLQTVQYHRLAQSQTRNRRFHRGWQQSMGFAVPAFVVMVFAGIFVLANPDLRETMEQWGEWVHSIAFDWMNDLDIGEFLFWIFSGALLMGILFPYLPQFHFGTISPTVAQQHSKQRFATFFYPASRNTLMALVPLFAIYLIYEFVSLGRREFPPGFYYAGYAHEGAFWLTFALALATLTLSAIFSHSMRLDPRTDRLKPLAFAWSVENLLLAVAVYNRLAIYIDFNGMTRMRVIGILGVTAVVAGTLLVVIKIVRARNLNWLIQRQLWSMAIAGIVYTLLPVDWMVYGYNVAQIRSGNLAPSVQMMVHELNAEGILQVVRLMDCQDEEIREGAKALASRWQDILQKRRAAYSGWTHYQIADRDLLDRLTALENEFAEYRDPETRARRIDQCYKYVYQWY